MAAWESWLKISGEHFNMKTYKASVFGSTGLIGGFLTDILINDPLCEQVVTLTRNKVIINNTKHKNRHIVNCWNCS